MTQELSKRESELLALASQGLTDKGIAATLGISVPTVVTYWARIRAKLGQLSRSELVAEYVRAEAEEAVHAVKSLLEAQIKRGTEIDRQRQMLMSFLDQAPEAILFIDTHGYIVNANQEAANLLQGTQDQLIGMKVDSFMAEETRLVHDQHRVNYLADPHRLEIGHESGVDIYTCTGESFRGIVTLSMAHGPTGDGIVAIMRSLEVSKASSASRSSGKRLA